MDSLHDYGGLLLGSRLRKVSETMYAGVDAVYRKHGIDLPSRCFPILFLLRDHGRLGISELALRLGQSHPAVSQMSRKLLAFRVVREWPDPEDERRRLLGLSSQGARLMRSLPPIWQAIVEAVAELPDAAALSAALTGVDQALGSRGFAARIERRLRAAEAGAVEIVPFAARHARDFKRLNLEWLRKYFRVEPIDEEVLSRPDLIIARGGAIFMARLHGRSIGACAILHAGGGRFELSKMAVTERSRGLGVGRRLLTAAIEEFHARGGRELFLESSSLLKPALTMYESAGFVHTPRPAGPVHYERSDVYMVYRGSRAIAR